MSLEKDVFGYGTGTGPAGGEFVDSQGAAHRWEINRAHALLWDADTAGLIDLHPLATQRIHDRANFLEARILGAFA
jgi:hypothetical protein